MYTAKHRLVLDTGKECPFYNTPNKSISAVLTNPKFVVLHYTAGFNPLGTISWFMNPAAKVSAHLLIDRNGLITQFVSFDKPAWHAGYSKYIVDGKTYTDLNSCSIGIELDNLGALKATETRIPDDRKIYLKHKLEVGYRWWETYPEKQIDSLINVLKLLTEAYSIPYIVGHEDISQSGKIDPGPAFPIDKVKQAVFEVTIPEPELTDKAKLDILWTKHLESK